MKKIDLSIFPDEMLESLREQIKAELSRRKKTNSSLKRIHFIHSLKPTDFESRSDALITIAKFNSDNLLNIPGIKTNEPTQYIKYLSYLLKQNWAHLYPRDSDNGEYYVYAHVDPRQRVFIAPEDGGGNYGGRPFYIGKGIGIRAFDLKRNEGHGKTIKEIIKEGFPPVSITKIVFSNLSEQKALEIEAKLIYFFGIKYSKNRKGWLVNLTEPLIPEFLDTMKKMPSRYHFPEHATPDQS